MKYAITDKSPNSVVAFSGEMGFQDFEIFRRFLDELDHLSIKSIVADLSELTKIDSAGVGMLLVLQETAEEKGFQVSIKGSEGEVQEVFEVCRLHEMIKMA